MLPQIENIHFEENRERLKVKLPLDRHWVYLVLYSIMLLIWIGMFITGLVFTVRMAISGERFAFVFTVMLLVLLVILVRLGRIVWGQWQYYAASRELLFVHKEMLIVRRPVSIFGLTTAFDRNHVTPFYFSTRHSCPAFDYGHQHVYFGQDLPSESARQLIQYLNGRYFPHFDEDNE